MVIKIKRKTIILISKIASIVIWSAFWLYFWITIFNNL